MRKAYDRLINAIQIFSGTLSILMLALVVVGVFYRYIVDQSLSWYDEFAGYILVWLTMYGSVVALARRKHIGFETLVEKLPLGVRRWVEAFGHLCVLAFSAVLIVYGWELCREMGDETAVSLTWVKMSWVYSVLPISGAFMALISVVQVVEAVVVGEAVKRAPSRDLEEPDLEALRTEVQR